MRDILFAVKQLHLPEGTFVVVGGASLAIRGLRETQDIDVIVLPEVFEALCGAGWPLDEAYEKTWGRKRIKKDEFDIHTDIYLENAGRFLDIPELIREADLIEGIRFQTVSSLRMCKADSGREKDLRDIALIDGYLQKQK